MQKQVQPRVQFIPDPEKPLRTACAFANARVGDAIDKCWPAMKRSSNLPHLHAAADLLRLLNQRSKVDLVAGSLATALDAGGVRGYKVPPFERISRQVKLQDVPPEVRIANAEKALGVKAVHNVKQSIAAGILNGLRGVPGIDVQMEQAYANAPGVDASKLKPEKMLRELAWRIADLTVNAAVIGRGIHNQKNAASVLEHFGGSSGESWSRLSAGLKQQIRETGFTVIK